MNSTTALTTVEKKEVEILPPVKSDFEKSDFEKSSDLYFKSEELFKALQKGEVIYPTDEELEELKKNLKFFIESDQYFRSDELFNRISNGENVALSDGELKVLEKNFKFFKASKEFFEAMK